MSAETATPGRGGGGRMARAAALFAFATGISRVLGLAREALVNGLFGVRGVINEFTVASQVPNVVRSLVADAALGAAFIPVFNELLEEGDERRAWRVASTVTTISVVGLSAICAVIMLFAEPFLSLIPGEDTHLTVELTWLLMPTVALLGFAGVIQAMLNSFDEFFLPAIAPVAWNVVIACFLVVGFTIDDPEQAVVLYGLGTLAGTVVQVAMPLPALLRRAAGRLRVSFDWRDPAVRRVFVLMLPVTLGLGLINVNALVDTVFASALDRNSAPRAIESAFRIYMLPQGMFSVAVAAVLFPAMSRLAAAGETARFRRSVSEGVRVIHYLLIPAAALSGVLAGPIVLLLYERGAFTADQRELVANCVAAYALGLPANGALLLVNRAFFSLQRPWLPTAAAAANVVLNAIGDLVLYRTLGAWGIPLATSIANLVFVVVMWMVLRRSVGRLDSERTLAAVIQMVGCAVGLVAVAWPLWYGVDRALGRSFPAQLIAVGIACGAGLATYWGLTRAIRMPEARLAERMVRRRLARRRAA